MQSMIQYVGNTKTFRVFVNVSIRTVQTENIVGMDRNSYPIHEIRMLTKDDGYLSPISPSDYPYFINQSGTCGRYEVRQYGDIFVADENHRDSYPFHLPGFKKIRALQIGDIIPINGLTGGEFLSDGDREIMMAKPPHSLLHEKMRSTNFFVL